MALEQGYIFMVAQHQEIITSFWNVGESGHSTSTVLGLTFQKSNSQPQNVRHGVFIPFQGLEIPAPHRMRMGTPSRGY